MEIAAFAAEVEAMNGNDCVEPKISLRTTPGGGRVSWQICGCMADPQYVPGSARLDGEPVADRYDTTQAGGIAALAAVYEKVFAGGQLLAFTQNSAAPRFVNVVAYGPAMELPDGATCYPRLTTDRVESPGDVENPLMVLCDESYRPGTVGSMAPFTLSDQDPAALAGVWEQAAAAGVPAEDVQYIEFAAIDGGPLAASVMTTSFRQFEIVIEEP